MSATIIRTSLNGKGLVADTVEYIRGHSGGGWLIVLTTESEQALMDAGYDGEMDIDAPNTASALAWIDELPNCKEPA